MKTWERRLAVAKTKHRPKLKDWGRDEMVKNAAWTALQQQQQQQHQAPSPSIAHVSSSLLPTEEFIRRFEKPCVPVVLQSTGTTQARLGSFRHLRRAYGRRMFKVGEDDDGYKVKVKLKYFLKYLENNSQADDSPLYVFDSTFDDDEVSKALLADYQVPRFFPDDLFSLVGERRRPPYRWFLVGPERSGTCVHTDPLGTSAWNTVVRGKKRWVLFPPETPRRIAKALDVIQKGEDDEAIHYFVTLLPRLRDLQRSKRGTSEQFEMIEFTQHEGDTVFVPGGWWHAVLNLTDTVAVTQNYCSHANFEAVWKQTREGRKKMAASWLKRLRVSYPHLAALADAANERDGWGLDKEGKRFVKKPSTALLPPPPVPSGTAPPATTYSTAAAAANAPRPPPPTPPTPPPPSKSTSPPPSDKHMSKAKQKRRDKKRKAREDEDESGRAKKASHSRSSSSGSGSGSGSGGTSDEDADSTYGLQHSSLLRSV